MRNSVVRWIRPLSALALVLLGAGVALAATGSGGSNAVHACYSKKTGALRVLSHGKCKGSERAITWSKTGPAGVTGARGIPGIKGNTGNPGSARAYAHVIANPSGSPTLDQARTKGFTAVAYGTPNGEADGEYCLTASGISPGSTAAVVSADYYGAFGPTQGSAYVLITHPDCSANQFEVITLDNNGTAHNVDFNIIVP